MIYGLSGAPVPADLPYAAVINAACAGLNFPPMVAYAIANRETIRGQRSGKWDAATVISGDGGHGLFQLTSWVPVDWAQPSRNAWYALHGWLCGTLQHYALHHGLRGDDLIRCVADAFNAGQGAVCRQLDRGASPDAITANGDYGADVIRNYHSLLSTGTCG